MDPAGDGSAAIAAAAPATAPPARIPFQPAADPTTRVKHRQNPRRQAARDREKAARKRPIKNDTRTPEEKRAEMQQVALAGKVAKARRRALADTVAVRRSRAQVEKVVEAGGLPEAPVVVADPTRPLDIGPAQHIARKLKELGARLRDGALRGSKDPVSGRSVIPPQTLLSLPGVQALALATRFLPGGRERFIEYVQLGALNGDATCQTFWQIWAELTPAERQIASFDDVCVAGNLKPADLLAAVVKHAVTMGLDVGRLIAASLHPQVIEAHMQQALKIDSEVAQVERLEHLRAVGVLPIVQKGPVVSISATAAAGAAAVAAAPAAGTAALSPFQAAMQAAGAARDDVIDAVVAEIDAAPRQLPAHDAFKEAIAAGIDAREPERVTIAADVLGKGA